MSDLLQGIDAIIFDFGNVLIDLNYPEIIRKLRKVARRSQSNIEDLVVNANVLQLFETGKIGPKRFRAEFNRILDINLSESEFDKIWNSLLGSISKERMDNVLEVGKRYKTYILSNSNIIHELAFEEMVIDATGRPSVRDFVDKAYFSHEIGMRKPDLECYQFVIEDIDLYPSRMLFLDDRLDNVAAAREAGMKAVQIFQPDKQINDIFGFGQKD
ncbi:MAG: HAD family phosphatase [Ekhidna sp.]|nr:HAD family phosphatase [Ekhidna sp.]